MAAMLFSLTGMCYAALADTSDPIPETGDSVYGIGDDTVIAGDIGDGDTTEFTVTVNYDADCGEVTVTPEQPAAGDTVNITVSALDEYAIESVTVTDAEGTEVSTEESEAEDIWGFVMPESDVTVSVTFLALAEFLAENDEYQPEAAANYANYAILYSDGYLVFQYGSTADPNHGSVIGRYTGFNTKEYSSVLEYNGLTAQTPWFDNREKVTNVVFKDITKPISTQLWFCRFSNLVKIENIGNLDTSGVTSMHGMFYGCSSLTELDLEGFNTSSVTTMIGMFYGCSSLTDVNLVGFDTSNVKFMSQMFYKCSSLSMVDLGGFDTSNVTHMVQMFDGCASLVELDLINFDTSKIRSMTNMFGNCGNLSKLSLGKNWSWVGTNRGLQDVIWYDVKTGDEFAATAIPDGAGIYTTMKPVFADTAILYSDGYLVFQYGNTPDPNHGSVIGTYTGFNTRTYSNHRDRPWNSNSDKVTNVLFKDITKPAATTCWFFDFCNLVKIDGIENLDTSDVTNMDCMFDGCINLTELDVTGFDTSNVTGMRLMFRSCRNLAELDVTGFDTSKVIRMGYMFQNMCALVELNVGGFDTSKVTDMPYMFNGCVNLTELDLTNFDTRKVTNMDYMFNNCSSLEKLSLGENWKWVGTNHGLNDVPWYNVETEAEFTATTIPNGAGVYTTVKPVTGAMDVNDDGSVDFYDVNYIIAVINSDSVLTAGLNAGDRIVKDNVRRADLNNDGFINIQDLNLWCGNYAAMTA